MLTCYSIKDHKVVSSWMFGEVFAIHFNVSHSTARSSARIITSFTSNVQPKWFPCLKYNETCSMITNVAFIEKYSSTYSFHLPTNNDLKAVFHPGRFYRTIRQKTWEKISYGGIQHLCTWESILKGSAIPNSEVPMRKGRLRIYFFIPFPLSPPAIPPHFLCTPELPCEITSKTSMLLATLTVK